MRRQIVLLGKPDSRKSAKTGETKMDAYGAQLFVFYEFEFVSDLVPALPG